ncbi:MAG TPA: MBL fold metallo-hydrolase RNA specificity domain-containing protein [Thermoanaerobaculia bacterium]|nr:MBL fold metallo-hydrolase RNA specificity domain-containing protein [Thermoanaerobaculia bacterium]
MPTVTFHGACGVVTGSCTHIDWGERQILVDCGLYQGGEELEARNRSPFPFRPAALTAVVVTHAHLDHTGLLPRLAAEGYSGPVYCTAPSRGLISLVLQDAGKIQEEEARYARRKGYSVHPEPEPLYTSDDARRAIKLLKTVPFGEERELFPGVRLRYVRAGHLLGAASAEISAKGSDGERRTWCFSGDLGRYGVPILKDPEPPSEPPAALLLESTYGDRRHSPEDAAEALGKIVEETYARGGMVIIPAFALGRTQDVLYYLSALVDAGRLDPSTVFLDSPMAISATEIYDRAEAEHDEDLAALVDGPNNPLAAGRFVRCRTVDQSRALNTRGEPAVIVASSGMANGGRVVHHLLHRLADPRSSVVFAGYQAAGTRGRAMIDGAETIAIHGRTVWVKAKIYQLQSLSAHADRDELLRWCRALPAAPQRIFLNHGEDPARKALAASIADELGWPRPLLPLTGEPAPW